MRLNNAFNDVGHYRPLFLNPPRMPGLPIFDLPGSSAAPGARGFSPLVCATSTLRVVGSSTTAISVCRRRLMSPRCRSTCITISPTPANRRWKIQPVCSGFYRRSRCSHGRRLSAGFSRRRSAPRHRPANRRAPRPRSR